jgi:predicted PurR-regulated permease PerM
MAALESPHSSSSSTLAADEARPIDVVVRNLTPFDALVFVICCGALYTLLPLWAPLMLAAWTAIATAPFVNRASSPHRRRRAAVIATAAAVALTVPLLVVAVFLSKALLGLINQITQADDKTEALRAILVDGEGMPLQLNAHGVITAIKEYSQGALSAFNVVVGVTTEVAIGLTIFVLATYTFLISGKSLYIWALDRLPLPRGHLHRLSNAFIETGHGLFLGIGVTALLQGLAAGVGYYILQIPQAAILALLTAVAAIIPTFGTTLVWFPVAIGLLFAGKAAASVILLGIGIVVSSVDNLVRPVLTRKGDLQLPTFLVFVAMLGGLAAFGGWGVILGPLLVRLAVEGLEILSPQAQH